MKNRIIAIDGPGGSGKSSVGRALAERLGFHFLDSGSLFRVMALETLEGRGGISALSALPRLDLLEALNDPRLRKEEVGSLASKLGVDPSIRALAAKWQREIAKDRAFVIVGRDIGSKIFPEAACKFFLVASPETRALRRVKELKERGEVVDFEKVLFDLRARDERDLTRECDPLVQSFDAIFVDTSDLSLVEVVDLLESEVNRKLAAI